MGRSSREEAQANRARVLQTASREFRRRGVSGLSVADLMHLAGGLTHGGFYKHFGSKDELAAEACRLALTETHAALSAAADAAPPERRLETIIRGYLTRAHRDNPETGCAIAALSGEITHTESGVRAALSEGFEDLLKLLERHMPPDAGTEAKARASAVLSGMIGALTLARMLGQGEQSDNLLRSSRAQLLRLAQGAPG